MGRAYRWDRVIRRDLVDLRPDLVGGRSLLLRRNDKLLFSRGGEEMSVSRVLVAIYYDPEKRDLLNGDLSRRLEGLEWWITTEEKLPEGKLKVLDLTQLKD